MKSSSTITRPDQPPPYERWWRCLFNESEDAQLVYTSDGSIKEANRTAIRLLGLSGREDALPNLFQMLTSAAAARVAALLQQPVGSQVTLPAVAIMAEGQISLLADLQITPLGQGFSLVTIRDATRRWRMESHVQRLVTAMDATPDVVFLTDAEFRLVFVNPSFLRDTGYSIEEALGRPAEFLRAAGQEEQWKQCLERVRGGKDWQGEFVNVRSDGSTYLAAVSMAPIFDRKGAFLGCVSFERDITQTRRQQQELQREAGFVRSIINGLEAAVYAVDRHFRLLYFNEGWKRFPAGHGGLHWDRPPRVGDLLLEAAADPRHQMELRRWFNEVLQSRAPRVFRWKGTDERWWVGRISPWTMQDHFDGLIYAVTDETPWHQWQNQWAHAHQMQWIGAWTALVVQKVAPILQTVRQNLLELRCREGTMGLSNLEHTEKVVAEASETLQQLQLLSQAAEPSETVVDFNLILKETAQLFHQIAGPQWEVRLQPSAVPLPVRLDRSQAHQLLLNLCANAQGAMPQGGQITLSNTPIKLNESQSQRMGSVPVEGWMRCSVRDTGCGIAPEHLPCIFDPLLPTKDTPKGQRMGLIVARHIATQVGGFIEVESQPGSGSTFHVYLPLSQEADLGAASHQPSGSPAPTISPTL